MSDSQTPVHIAHPCKDYPTSYNYFSTFREEPGLSVGDKYAGGQAAFGAHNIRPDLPYGWTVASSLVVIHLRRIVMNCTLVPCYSCSTVQQTRPTPNERTCPVMNRVETIGNSLDEAMERIMPQLRGYGLWGPVALSSVEHP